jgi:hypothetical protein
MKSRAVKKHEPAALETPTDVSSVRGARKR